MTTTTPLLDALQARIPVLPGRPSEADERTDHDDYAAAHRAEPAPGWVVDLRQARAEERAERRLAALLAEAEPGWREDERRWRDLDEAREASEYAARWAEAPDDYEEGW